MSKKYSFKANQKYQDWIVLDPTPVENKIKCSCTLCGRAKFVSYLRLLNGKSKNCGCNTKKNKIKVGEIYGFWKVQEVASNRYFECLCTGCNITIKKIDYTKLLSGEHQSCGCKREELRRQTSQDNWDNPSYSGSKHYKEHLPKYLDKLKQTNQKRWSASNYSQSEDYKKRLVEIKKKKIQTGIDKQQVQALSTGETITEYCRRKEVAYDQAKKIFNLFGEESFLSYCKNYKNSITNLELQTIGLLEDSFDISHYNRTPQEFSLNRRPDFRLEKNNKVLYLNVDGLYYHSEKIRERRYHLTLVDQFKENDQVIFQFYENEIRDKSAIVKSIVQNYFHIHDQKYAARKGEIRKIPPKEATLFFEENHLMGAHKSSTAYGLYFDNILMTSIAVKRINKNGIDISRFCSKLNCVVQGGFSRLLRHVEKLYSPTFIQSFCDRRYSTGHSYHTQGFHSNQITLGWSWTDGVNIYNRLRCRAKMDSRNLSQADHAKELGWYKIYDAGQEKFIKELV